LPGPRQHAFLTALIERIDVVAHQIDIRLRTQPQRTSRSLVGKIELQRLEFFPSANPRKPSKTLIFLL
jgi:hypothetical protein